MVGYVPGCADFLLCGKSPPPWHACVSDLCARTDVRCVAPSRSLCRCRGPQRAVGGCRNGAFRCVSPALYHPHLFGRPLCGGFCVPAQIAGQVLLLGFGGRVPGVVTDRKFRMVSGGGGFCSSFPGTGCTAPFIYRPDREFACSSGLLICIFLSPFAGVHENGFSCIL